MIGQKVEHPQFGAGQITAVYRNGSEWLVRFENGLRFRRPANEFNGDGLAVAEMGTMYTIPFQPEPMSSSQLDARQLIESLRVGIAPAQHVPELTINLRAERESLIAKDIKVEMSNRLAFLKQVGLEYLSLDRSAPTLSGGEAQRIRLASQLGTNLEGVCYVLDEPSIGLHPRDNQRLIDALLQLKNKNNTLVVVEHDVETILHADHLVDIGPGAGKLGGQIIAQGTVSEVKNHPRSLTGRYLHQPIKPLAQPQNRQ